MSFWILTQVIVNIVFVVGFVVGWTRLKRPPQDDPRLSRGLQLLQSKIAVLEDLSDRTEVQVSQLTALLEQKSALIQKKIQEAEVHISKIDRSMNKSLEVAEIFQDKIPHEEVIERQNTIKYVQAARLAHQGKDFDEIAAEVDLPRAEIEFIAKVNKEELMFDESQLPDWFKAGGEISEQIEVAGTVDVEMIESPEEDEVSAPLMADYASAFSVPDKDFKSLKNLGDEFRRACSDHDRRQEEIDVEQQRIVESTQRLMEAAKSVTEKIVHSTEDVTQKIVSSAEGVISEASQKAKEVQQRLSSRRREIEVDAPQLESTEAKGLNVHATSVHVPDVHAAPSVKKVDEANSAPQISPASGKQKPIVTDLEIRKVEFPKIDMTDNLG